MVETMIQLSWLEAVGIGKETAMKWLEDIESACVIYRIDRNARIAAFLAQCAHESQGFLHLQENLNYKAERLMQVWPKRFHDLAQAEQYAHNSARLANYVYADRMGNGDAESGDGYKFRGRGLIHATGRDMYTWLSEELNIECLLNPDLLLVPRYAAWSAAAIWALNKNLNPLADTGDFKEITRRINGGYNGLDDRLARWNAVKLAMTQPALA